MKYGQEDLLHRRVNTGTMSEIDELKTARKENRELKATLADAHMELVPRERVFRA